ncbi:hypothetical protein TcasGA2_TC002772 [Tribolium castaneum]|uniref:Uncharacterized protein n=1 Tax=Tribolium castaneum TaxID=7070 RepID=D6WDH4_TRICA|nr:hypothetical protein TcasGA2_TC002772 [Tribolium castaneum]
MSVKSLVLGPEPVLIAHTVSALDHLLSPTVRRFVINNAFITANFQLCIVKRYRINIIPEFASFSSEFYGLETMREGVLLTLWPTRDCRPRKALRAIRPQQAAVS